MSLCVHISKSFWEYWKSLCCEFHSSCGVDGKLNLGCMCGTINWMAKQGCQCSPHVLLKWPLTKSGMTVCFRTDQGDQLILSLGSGFYLLSCPALTWVKAEHSYACMANFPWEMDCHKKYMAQLTCISLCCSFQWGPIYGWLLLI